MTIEKSILNFLKDKKAFYTVNEIVEWLEYHHEGIKATSIRPTISVLYLKGKIRRERVDGSNKFLYGGKI